jgi:hypothetical protein
MVTNKEHPSSILCRTEGNQGFLYYFSYANHNGNGNENVDKQIKRLNERNNDSERTLGILHILKFSHSQKANKEETNKQKQNKNQTNKQTKTKTKQICLQVKFRYRCSQMSRKSLRRIVIAELIKYAENGSNLYFGPFYLEICIDSFKVRNTVFFWGGGGILFENMLQPTRRCFL